MKNLRKIHMAFSARLTRTHFLKDFVSKTKLNIAIGSLAVLINLGLFSEVAQATTRQVILNLDSVSIRSFSELLAQAEALASTEIYQQFQNDPNLTEVQVLVLGERSGQIVSILSSQVTRETWENTTDIRPWTRYLTSASVLLGYTPSQVARRQGPNNGGSSISSNSRGLRPQAIARGTTSISNDELGLYPREEIGDAMINGEISVNEYWDLLDTLD